MTIPILSTGVWASGNSFVVVEEKQIDCEELYLLEFLEDEQIHYNNRLDGYWLRNFNPRNSDEEKYTENLYFYIFYDRVDEANYIYFTPAGNSITAGESQCPRKIARDNAILILEKCAIQEEF